MENSLSLIGGLFLLVFPACLCNNINTAVPTTTTEFTPTQYHIQTDEGDRRFFKYQTWSGQIRKENRLDDGSVVGTYGWIDANGILRLYDYIADSKGYRIVKTRLHKVGKEPSQANVEKFIETSKLQTDEKLINHGLLSNDIENTVSSKPQLVENFDQRLQRKISTADGKFETVNFEPLFDYPDKSDVTTVSTKSFSPTSPPRRRRIGRNRFQQIDANPIDNFGPHSVARSRAEAGRKLVVVKRRKQSGDGFNYQTAKAFHHEESDTNGKRSGQFGYIDPIGIRRVVNYSTGPRGEIEKSKENDFVGVETYFEANR